MDNTVRIQKFLADCGRCSRRAGEQLVSQGRVTVNGKVAKTGQPVAPGADKVCVDGVPVRAVTKKHTYIMMYKPRGYVTTLSDEFGRKCVSDLLQDVNARVFPIGRLDRDSEGMLLFTDDGELANAIMSPRTHLPKTYRVTVSGTPSAAALEEMRHGMTVDDGTALLPAEVSIRDAEEGRTVLHITLYEGKNRQIRRMCEHFGLDVKLLKRENIGRLMLGSLRPGQIRYLEAEEEEYLKNEAGGNSDDSIQ